MKLAIRDLLLVRAVARHGTLTAAAAELHVTPSALSHQLRSLEDRLEQSLFLRVGKRMVATEPGRLLLDRSARVLADLERTEDELAALAGQRTGTLRISTACYTSYPWLPGLLRSFGERHPEVDLQLRPELTSDPVAAVLDGRLDVAITFAPVVGPELVHRVFLHDEMVVLVGPEHPLAGRATVRPEELRDVDLVLYNADPRGSLLMAEILGPAGVAPRTLRGVPLTEAIVELVHGGPWVSFLASWAVEPHLERRRLVPLRLGPRGVKRRWKLVALRDSPAAAALPELASLLRSQLGRPRSGRRRGSRRAG